MRRLRMLITMTVEAITVVPQIEVNTGVQAEQLTACNLRIHMIVVAKVVTLLHMQVGIAAQFPFLARIFILLMAWVHLYTELQVIPILLTHTVVISLVVGCLPLLQLIRLRFFIEDIQKIGFFVAC